MLLALWSAHGFETVINEEPQRGGGAASGYFYVYNQAVRKKDKEYEESQEQGIINPQVVKRIVSAPYIEPPKPDLNKLFWDSEERKAKIANQFYIAFTRYQELEARRLAEIDDEATLLLLLN